MTREPKIFVTARPSLDLEAVAAFLRSEQVAWNRTKGATEAEELIELCGRICYLSFGNLQSPRTNAEYIRNLIVSGHESVLEHASWTFIVTGVSRAFTHQLVRHRVGFAFSQLSQQYHDETSPEFVLPAHLEQSPRAMDIWESHMRASVDAYREIAKAANADLEKLELVIGRKEHKRALRSAARSVLPNATETKLSMTANARALRHFLAVRGSIPGDVEMRIVASEILRVMNIEAPSVFADFVVSKLDDGSPIVVKQ